MTTDVLTEPSLFDPLLSVTDVMEVLGASRSAVYAWLRGGKQAGRKLFIKHARTLLPAETYDAIWSRVDAELRGAERA